MALNSPPFSHSCPSYRFAYLPTPTRLKICMKTITNNNVANTDDNLFLPDFCKMYTVFVGIVVTELLAAVLVLAPLSQIGYDWGYVRKNLVTDLAMVSLFMQSVTLISMALLCLVRRWLCALDSNIIAGLVSYLLILIVTLGISEIAWQFKEFTLSSASYHQLFLWRNLGISAIIGAIAWHYFYLQSHWKTETEALASARAQALQARIRPHFLFNGMNTIASLIRFQPEKAEQVVEDFADLFRASLTEVKSCVTIKKELALCRQYLGIEALRLRERLQVVWKVDNIPDDALLPPLCLQPLLENAVYHGIQPLPEGGTISIYGLFDGKYIQLDVENPLAATVSPHQGNRMAQQNIQQRLLFFYGTQAKLNVQRGADKYRVVLYFPYKNQDDENTYRR